MDAGEAAVPRIARVLVPDRLDGDDLGVDPLGEHLQPRVLPQLAPLVVRGGFEPHGHIRHVDPLGCCVSTSTLSDVEASDTLEASKITKNLDKV